MICFGRLKYPKKFKKMAPWLSNAYITAKMAQKPEIRVHTEARSGLFSAETMDNILQK
ncbi:hypothetical protein MKMG_00024 [Methanogenium sp. MK-MG]|nr:hypothetical protein MKMG_00024 [Methanogenium sp. MK-MG]